MLHKDEAICLRAVNYSETSQVVTLFGRTGGKISAMAKGSKRPKSSFGGPIEVFSFGDIIYSPTRTGGLATLTEFVPKPVFRGLRTRLFALNCGLFAAELINSFTQEADAHIELFDALYGFLGDVQEQHDHVEAVRLLVLFQLTLLGELGTRPVLNRCANCNCPYNNAWPEAYFSSTVNGLICYDCEQVFVDKIRLAKSTAKCLNDLRMLKDAPQPTVNGVEKVLIYHFTALLHRPPKMAKHFLNAR